MSSHPVEPNVVAILVASLAWFAIGFVWYTLLFKNAWAKGMGMDPDMKPSSGEMARSMALGMLGILLTVAVFAWLNLAIRPAPALPQYVEGALWVWLGFFVPRALTAVAWEARPWSVAGINASHDLVGLVVVAAILGAWP